jgi:hypothetical protein
MRGRISNCLLTISLLLPFAVLIGCTADLQSNLVGKWEQVDENGQVVTKPITLESGKITVNPGTIEFKADGTYVITMKPRDGTFTNSGSYKITSGSTIALTSVDPPGSISEGKPRENIYDASILGDKLTLQVKDGEFPSTYQKKAN